MPLNELEARLTYDILMEWLETHEFEHEVLRSIAQSAADKTYDRWKELSNEA